MCTFYKELISRLEKVFIDLLIILSSQCVSVWHNFLSTFYSRFIFIAFFNFFFFELRTIVVLFFFLYLLVLLLKWLGFLSGWIENIFFWFFVEIDLLRGHLLLFYLWTLLGRWIYIEWDIIGFAFWCTLVIYGATVIHRFALYFLYPNFMVEWFLLFFRRFLLLSHLFSCSL